MTKTVLILGANGKIGHHSARAFADAGWHVRKYDRANDMTQAAIGVDVIVNGLNPPAYRHWAQAIPAITRQVIAAAQASDATVIIPGNIYNFGDIGGAFDADTPQHPHTRKGRIRVAMEDAYRAAGVQVIVLRAGNFIDPTGNGDYMSMLAMRDIAKGKIIAAGDIDVLQAYAFVPDWARAAVMLADMRADLAQFEDVPFPGHAFTTRDLLHKVQAATGQDIKLAQFPWWMMILLAPFWGLAREMREMRYLYSMSHHLDGAKFDRLLPHFKSMDLDHVMLCGLPPDVYPNKAMRSAVIE